MPTARFSIAVLIALVAAAASAPAQDAGQAQPKFLFQEPERMAIKLVPAIVFAVLSGAGVSMAQKIRSRAVVMPPPVVGRK